MTDARLDELAAFADYLARSLRELGGPALVEHLWHLADLEREGFAVRISRLRSEENPELADFDGDRIARERDYRSRDAAEGLEAFRAARDANLATLRSLSSEEWTRAGHLEGYGPITLQELPELMLDHDRSHRAEIRTPPP